MVNVLLSMPPRIIAQQFTLWVPASKVGATLIWALLPFGQRGENETGLPYRGLRFHRRYCQ